MKSKIALVTGGTGFIGTYLCKKLIGQGWKINIVDLKKSKDSLINKKCKFFKYDINKIQHNNECFKRVDVIFHFAAIPSISRKNKKKFLLNNLDGTKNIIKCAKKNNIKNIIYSSSSTVYGIPNSMPLKESEAGKTIGYYGLSKWLGEKELLKEKNKMKICILRPRVVIGPGRLGVFELLFKRILNNKKIYLIGNGQNYFQFTNVEDFIDAAIKCVSFKRSMIFNIGSSDKVKTIELLNSLIKKTKSKSEIIRTPAFMIKIALFILDAIQLSPLTKEQYLIADKHFFLSTKKAKTLLNWKSKFSTLQTLFESFKWFEKNYNKYRSQTKQFGILTKFNRYGQSGFQK